MRAQNNGRKLCKIKGEGEDCNSLYLICYRSNEEKLDHGKTKHLWQSERHLAELLLEARSFHKYFLQNRCDLRCVTSQNIAVKE